MYMCARLHAHDCVRLQLSPYLTEPRKRRKKLGFNKEKEKKLSIRLLHKTYFYIQLFALAYTRLHRVVGHVLLVKRASVLCRTIRTSNLIISF